MYSNISRNLTAILLDKASSFLASSCFHLFFIPLTSSIVWVSVCTRFDLSRARSLLYVCHKREKCLNVIWWAEKIFILQNKEQKITCKDEKRLVSKDNYIVNLKKEKKKKKMLTAAALSQRTFSSSKRCLSFSKYSILHSASFNFLSLAWTSLPCSLSLRFSTCKYKMRNLNNSPVFILLQSLREIWGYYKNQYIHCCQ